MALNTIEDVVKLEELLALREEYNGDNSLKAEIILEGVKKRLETMLALQTTELGRIESNPPDFTEIYLREQDATQNLKEKYKLLTEKKVIVIPIKDFIIELKFGFRDKINKELEKLKEQLAKIDKLISK